MIRPQRLALLLAVASAPALAAFDGAWAPANWTVANTGILTGLSPVPGTGVFSTTQLVLTGSNTTSTNPGSFVPGCSGGVYGSGASPCRTQATISLAGSYTFSWSYTTSDSSGPGGDIFGILVDGTPLALSDPGGASTQSGVRTVSALSSFGWYVNCTDCIEGSAKVTISNFVVAVPEPASWALMVGGGLGLAGWRRRQQRQRR